jgi:hypothetical protein
MGTRRFFADGRIPLAHAVVALVRHARESEDDFDIGPLHLGTMAESGLVISGPDADSAAEVVARIPGLAEDAQPD